MTDPMPPSSYVMRDLHRAYLRHQDLAAVPGQPPRSPLDAVAAAELVDPARVRRHVLLVRFGLIGLVLVVLAGFTLGWSDAGALFFSLSFLVFWLFCAVSLIRSVRRLVRR